MENCEELNKTFHENIRLMNENREWITEKLTRFFIENFNIEPETVNCGDRCSYIDINTGVTSLKSVDTSIFNSLGLECDFIASFNNSVILRLHFPEGEKK